MTYKTCPRCDDVKCFRLVGSYEPDTNSYPSPEVDESLSCKCDLSAEEWAGLIETLTMDDFIPDYDY